jgi:ankyrin repeat protein
MPQVAQRLCHLQADINAQDDLGKTALFTAAKCKDNHMIQILLELKASSEVRDHEGWNPLHAAASSGNVEMLHSLILAKADCTAETASKKTPLHQAAHRYGTPETASALISAGADLEAVDALHKTGLLDVVLIQ